MAVLPTDFDRTWAKENNVAVGCGHIRPLYTAKRYRQIIRDCVKALKAHTDKFDAVAITGYSSALIGPSVALRLNKNLCLVRKDSEQRASGWAVEGLVDQKYIFIDDLIATGATIGRIVERMNSLNGNLYGVYLYNDCELNGGGFDRVQEKIRVHSHSRVKLLNLA